MDKNLSVNRTRLLNIGLLLALGFILLFWGLGNLPFFNRGEPREGLVVWEMYHSGNWILPNVNGEYIPFKPPLFHWLALVPAYLFGRVDEFTLRLPSALLAMLGILMTYVAGARLWGERAGLIAGVVLATCVEWWHAGGDTQVDMTLAFFISASCLLFYDLYNRQDFGVLKCLCLPLLLGLATLAKGPVGLAVPALVILVFLSVRRDFSFLTRLHLLPSAIVFLAVAGSWYALALRQGGWPFFTRQIVNETLLTAVGSYGHHQPIYYYIPIFFENTMPWSFFFPALVLDLYRRRRQVTHGHLLFPFVWLVTILVFFSFSLGKRGVYLLPLYPAFAMLFGAWWQRFEAGELDDRLPHWLGWFVASFYALGLAALCLYFAGHYGLVDLRLLTPKVKSKNVSEILNSLVSLSRTVTTCLIAFTMALVCLIWTLVKKNRRITFASLIVIAAAISVIIQSAIFPRIAFARTMKPFAQRAVKTIDAKDLVLFYRGFDYGVFFYSGRHIPSYARNAAEVKPPFFLLMWEEDWIVLRGRGDLQMVDISHGLGAAGRHRLVLALYHPTGDAAPLPMPVSPRNNNLDADGD